MALPLIAHVVYRFDVGGMENGLVNLINTLPAGMADHLVIALTESNANFAARIVRPGVKIVEVHKPPGQTLFILPRMIRTLRALRPAIVHTRNVGTLEIQLAAWLAGVPHRLHGEHGWDMSDLDGTNRKMLWLRRAMAPFVQHQIALSDATVSYLVRQVGIPAHEVTNICNGVDVDRFSPAESLQDARTSLPGWPFSPDTFVVGAVGRLAAVKNLPMLINAYSAACAGNPEFRQHARLVLIGDGPELAATRSALRQAGVENGCWLAGARSDVPACLRALNVLCLPSLAEGISNTVLEAMATGLPVIATDVGGNGELVLDGETGFLIPSGDIRTMAAKIEQYFIAPATRERHGAAARRRAVTKFNLKSMVDQYHAVYARLLQLNN